MGKSDLPACLLSSTKPSKFSQEVTCFSSSSTAAYVLISPFSECRSIVDKGPVLVCKTLIAQHNFPHSLSGVRYTSSCHSLRVKHVYHTDRELLRTVCN